MIVCVCMHACLFPFVLLMCAVLLRECTLDFLFFPPLHEQFWGGKKSIIVELNDKRLIKGLVLQSSHYIRMQNYNGTSQPNRTACTFLPHTSK